MQDLQSCSSFHPNAQSDHVEVLHHQALVHASGSGFGWARWTDRHENVRGGTFIIEGAVAPETIEDSLRQRVAKQFEFSRVRPEVPWQDGARIMFTRDFNSQKSQCEQAIGGSRRLLRSLMLVQEHLDPVCFLGSECVF